MTGARPGPRRGLGRGLGSLIPTQAPVVEPESDREAGTPDTPGGADGAVGGVVQAAAEAPDVSVPADVRPGLEDLAPVEGAYFVELPPEQIRPNRVQPRSSFDEEAMAELVHSVREIGLLQPIVVRRTGPESYELVMGERRWRASQAAGLERIPAIVRETEDTDMLRDALLENLHRSQLNPLEEASAYAQLLEDFGITHEELAQRIGRSRPQISNTLRLLRLSPAVQRRVAAGVLSAGHARALLSVDDADLQDRLASRIVAEGISVRALEEIVAVGDQGTQRRSPGRRRPSAPGLSEIADRLSDRFETTVKVDLGRSKGKITVDFASLEDLQRILEVMDPRNRTDRPV
ncbi:ParB/RepB/Spo0J family partition protein [Nocardioides sp. AX2bis]|uniref:ParB/RepB/Spo0J family partition protein n=1 Tax=Nocardioides sp. AX2bis TaxID=2653157 RepID=UPI0012EF6B3E|nr:ParB/RepB/Spo0J family partition protein [Nocardioides sp. AX2bis]VXA91566.1 putative chromosome-partitioning protein ParB [Nocardioides sp. AX2bis]